MNKIKFTYHTPNGDRRHFVDEEDVKVLLSRLPQEIWKRLKVVHFNDQGWGRKRAGYTTRRGRKEIALCAFPPRISLSSYLRRSQNPGIFGAIRGSQWPTLAVRRFMLYDTFLHELGHLQVIDRKAKNENRKFASETKAQDFAEFWCKKLWSEHFDHSDPVHNSPSQEEMEQLTKFWKEAHSEYKKGLIYEGKKRRDYAAIHYSKAAELYSSHALALEALGIFNYDTIHSSSRSVGLLQRAVDCDPTLHDANLFLGLAFAEEHKEAKAIHYLERAMRFSSRPSGTRAVYARVLANLGYFEEAKAMFQKAIKKSPKCPFVLKNYQIFLLHENNPEKDHNIEKAASLFQEKDRKIIQDRISIYSRGLRIIYWHDLSESSK
jgi:tetratricopeptide (TPR) repeat protein